MPWDGGRLIFDPRAAIAGGVILHYECYTEDILKVRELPFYLGIKKRAESEPGSRKGYVQLQTVKVT